MRHGLETDAETLIYATTGVEMYEREEALGTRGGSLSAPGDPERLRESVEDVRSGAISGRAAARP